MPDGTTSSDGALVGLKARRLERVRRLRGICYWPTWSRTPVDNWTVAATVGGIARELGFAAGMGFNGVRLWTNVYGWEAGPASYERHLHAALDSCADLGLGVDLVLFDSCGIDPELGHAHEVPLEALVAQLPPGELMRSFEQRGPGVDIYEAGALVRVPSSGEEVVAIWEGWTPSPGYYHLGADERPRWHRFAKSLLSALGDHEALVLVEVMNEPFVTHLGRPQVDRAPIRDFYRDIHRLVLDHAPDVPVTIGAESLERFQEYEADLDAPLDVVSFHPLTYDAERFKALLQAGCSYADLTGRPALASEWGTFPGAHDAAQLESFEALLPIALASGAAWFQSHLIAGYGPFALTALLYPNGTQRPAAEYVRRVLSPAEVGAE